MSAQLENHYVELKAIIGSYCSTSEHSYLNLILDNEFNRTKTLTFSEFKKLIDVSIKYLRQKLTGNQLLNLLRETADFMFIHGEKGVSFEIYNKLIKHGKKQKTKISSNIIADSYLGLANIWAREANWKNTNTNLKKAKAIFSKSNNREGLALTENFLGTILAEKGEVEKARKQFEYALTFITKTKNNIVRNKIRNNLGIICTMLEKYSEAKELLDEALSDAQNSLNLEKQAEIMHNMGMLLLKEGKNEEALELFEQSNSIAVKKDIHPITGISLLGLAETFYSLNNLELSEQYLLKCQEISYKINDRLTIADSYKIESLIKKSQGNFDLAESLLLASIQINKEFSNRSNLAESYLQLGQLYIETKNRNAKKYLSLALDHFRGCKNSIQAEKIQKLLDTSN